MAETTRTKHSFRVKESASGKPWIMFELLEGEDLPVLGKGFLGFDLKGGTTASGSRGAGGHDESAGY